MKISLITITRNNAEGLRRTIGSVLAQTHADVEHIIVDGGSTDGSETILKENPSRAIILSDRPSGVYNAINTGLAAATGDVIGLLHAGDVFSSTDILQRVAGTFAETDAPDYIFGDIHFPVKGKCSKVRRYSGCGITLDTLRMGIAPPHPSLYMTAATFRKTGFYVQDYIIAADFDMFIRLFMDKTLKGEYLPLDMVEMEPGGISARLYSRIVINNREKLRALRENGVPASIFHIMKRYFHRKTHKINE